MKKAIAIHAVFLIAVIVISFVFIIALFFQWIDVTKFGTNQATCYAKLMSYCGGLCKNDCKKESFDWNTKAPLGCEQFGMIKPTICANSGNPACVEECSKSGRKQT